MQIEGQAALVTGGASGLGEATARALAAAGATVVVLDRNAEAAQAVAASIGGRALVCDIADGPAAASALAAVAHDVGPLRIVMNVAGIGTAKRIVGRDGQPAPLEDFERVVRVNLLGTYNICRLVAAQLAAGPALGEDGERGVFVNTASVAAFDGQVGQEAYAASKGGVAAMTLPMARDLAQHGIRVCTIAPGLFRTPLVNELPAAVQDSLAASIPFPRRLGTPAEFAALALHIVGNPALNGEVIRLDGALRLAPR